MRFKKPFTIIFRRKADGSRVYYYRVWNPTTGRRAEFSTHQKSRQAAEHFAECLRIEGRLVPSLSPLPVGPSKRAPQLLLVGAYMDIVDSSSGPAFTFGEFARDWWGPDCPYCRHEAQRGKILSRRYVDLCALRLRSQILPAFAEVPLEQISVPAIENWMSGIPGGPRVRNTALQTFRCMLEEAVRLDLLTSNPCRKVKKFKEQPRARELFTSEELSKLFQPENWPGPAIRYLACLTARWTAMRAGEVLGIQAGSIFKKDGGFWLRVEVSWDRKQLKGTKNGKPRVVPIPMELGEILSNLGWTTGFLFSEDGGQSAMTYQRVRDALANALTKIGIPRTEQVRRGLGMHAFRHLMNTKLRKVVDDTDVRAVVGHLSQSMTEHYTHESTETLGEVSRAIQKLFDEESKNGRG